MRGIDGTYTVRAEARSRQNVFEFPPASRMCICAAFLGTRRRHRTCVRPTAPGVRVAIEAMPRERRIAAQRAFGHGPEEL